MKGKKEKKNILFLIILNEFCERYCFYSIKSILFTFLIEQYKLTVPKSTFLVHMFVFISYLFGVVGGIVADGFLGRYKTIIYFNLLYLLGNLFLLLSSYHVNLLMLILSLIFISIGTGGLKPCISAFGGDQLINATKSKVEGFFSVFYFSINAGSLFGILLTPILSKYNCLSEKCFSSAFKISTLIHSLSIVLFLVGSMNYTKKSPDKQFIVRLWKYLRIKYLENKGDSSHNKNEIEIICPETQRDVNSVINIFKIFFFVAFFWMLNDQHSSNWIDQGNQMRNTFYIFNYKFTLYPSQMAAVNAFSIILMIPLFVNYVYPFFNARKMLLKPLEKMYLGLAMTIISFVVSTFLQIFIDLGYKFSLLMQIPQYLLLTIGEILMSITGLQFAYSNSPESMKSLVFSGWLLTTALGNFYIMVLSIVNPFKLFNLSFTIQTQIFSCLISVLGLYWMILTCRKYEI
ncbi:hypothetical protein H312_00734 [Anncaliia algerae PRA339]|uniref:Major facilitator superfamily (MFS) profile domain-containing protein n=1 Tax=Anncaliia algerae PRA339 TaxID=1288291 RepID=A0A059F3P5_9MICR|nr:hypothetical protein H312_00734 [Anncaliia algerae PRA339]